MPQVDASTPREEYTIAGQALKIFQPYTSGHVLSDGEASALNQTYAENIRNNQASRVKELVEAGTYDTDAFQLELDDYMGEYEFGLRRGGGGRSGDPVLREALLIAKDKVRSALKAKGHNLKDVSASDITTLAKQVLDGGKYPQIMEAAKARVAAQADIADIELADPAPAATVDQSAEPTRRAKAAAE